MNPSSNPIARFMVSASVIIFIFSACNKSDDASPGTNNSNINFSNLQTQVNNLPKDSLSEMELKRLNLIREEEKLARDVYTTLNTKWKVNIFANISSSEQTHMNAVSILLSKYDLADPVGSNSVGVFSDSALQTLYNHLVDKGNVSLLDAYTVGATVEDLDIYDLKTALISIDNQDIRLVFDLLSKGSRNHLRSFYKNILSSGGSYLPQFISQEDFDSIINSEMETGF